ncbi:MAG: choice-of-anchor L domain-containing protein [Bacteroidetes bacterium]|nr:choice-of-anchor L domain-containing protein [Bacteroidota bacterium]
MAVKKIYQKKKKELQTVTCERFMSQFGIQFLYAFLLLLLADNSFSQVAITYNGDAQSITQFLTGSGVTISNYTINCDNKGIGTFTSTGTNLGISQGVVLSTGNIASIPQVASSLASTKFTNTGDAQLSTLTTGVINDKCVLEFDIVPQGSVLKFEYVFGSEEYPEFVCSQYNDVFGFFISGPDPGGGNYTNKNLATIPNTTVPVCINSVNPGVPGTYQGNTWSSGNCQSLANTGFYVNNALINNPNIVYDGMTGVFSAIAQVTPCQTYHLKIAIADVTDRIYDSGVFLRAYSISAAPYNVSVTSAINYPGYTSTYEGCVNGTINVGISAAQASNVTLNLTVTGSATNGTDYNTIPSTVTIPAGQTSVSLPFTPVNDNITEGTETVTISVVDVCTGLPSATTTISIQDPPTSTLVVGDSTLCSGQSTQLTASGAAVYAWSPSTGLNSSSIANPIASPTSTTTYTVTMTAGSCVKILSKTISVSNLSTSITASPNGLVCNGGSVQLTASNTGGVNPISFSWSNGNATSSINVSTSGTYNVTATDAFSCTASASRATNISNINVSGSSTDVSCFGANNGSISLSVAGLNSPFTYNWGGGISTQNRTNLTGGSYTVTVSNTAGCTATASFSISQPSSSLSISASTANIACFGGNNGAINLSVSGGSSPYTFSWGAGVTTQNRTNLSAGNYTVTVTDASTCSSTFSTAVTQPVSGVNITPVPVSASCFGTSTGSISLTLAGGTAPYTYNWGGGVTTSARTNIPARKL